MDTNRIIYNGTIEVSARLLLLLSVLDTPKDAEFITVCDLIITYGKSFNVLDYNLHGHNETAAGELTARRQSVNNALRYLVRHSLVDIKRSDKGFLYLKNDKGQAVCNQLQTEYSSEYLKLTQQTLHRLNTLSYTQILDIIHLPTNN